MISTKPIEEAFLLMAEHADCWCPAGFKASNTAMPGCPKHDALSGAAYHEGYGYDEDAGCLVISQNVLTDVHSMPGYLSGGADTPPLVVALVLWRIIVEMCGDEEPLYIEDGETITAAAERYIRDNADEAMSMIFLSRSPSGETLAGPLDDLVEELRLTDQFTRIMDNTEAA